MEKEKTWDSALHKVVPLSLVKHQGAKRVLLVEDDLSLQYIFDSIFFDIDPKIEMSWVSNAEVALSRLEDASRRFGKIPFDLVILDIFVDGKITGIDLWNLCQSVYPMMPAVVMSTLPSHRFNDFIGSSGISPPFIQKPLRLSECREILEGLLI